MEWREADEFKIFANRLYIQGERNGGIKMIHVSMAHTLGYKVVLFFGISKYRGGPV